MEITIVECLTGLKTLAHNVPKRLVMINSKYNSSMKVKDLVRQRLVELREERGWTQKEVASRLNISQRAYSHYESGSRSISLELLVDIAELYGVNVSFLVAEKTTWGDCPKTSL